MGLLSALSKRVEVSRAPPRIAAGQRVYAIGDIHGCVDLFAELMMRIEQDTIYRGPARTEIVILGDFIDRGPDSARMIELLRAGTAIGSRFVVLKGNHEATMIEALRGRPIALGAWLSFGGDATLRSFGIPRDVIERRRLPELMKMCHDSISPDARRWLHDLPLSHRVGDFLFVHAGIAPGIPIDQQHARDLITIRAPFLQSSADHGFVVVHGHSTTGRAEMLPNRIGIDTAAYRSGQLTALGIEEDRLWMIETGPTPQ